MVKNHYLQTQSRLPRMLWPVSSQMCSGGGGEKEKNQKNRGVFKDNECKHMSSGLSQEVNVNTDQQKSFKWNTKARFHVSSYFLIAPTERCKTQPRLLAPTLHPNMRDSVRLLQMTLHWHMTGERHLKFLTGRDISPETRGKQTAQERGSSLRRSAHSEARCCGQPRRAGEGGGKGTWPRRGPAAAGSDRISHV